MSTESSLRIAMVGTKGVPATFGGIERHVEELGARLAARGHRVTVHCRRNYTLPSRERLGRHETPRRDLALGAGGHGRGFRRE
jgi:hypothetical protein